jgi:hypothetical protein
MFTTTLAVVGLFALRIGLPLVFMLALGEMFTRLDGRRDDLYGRPA